MPRNIAIFGAGMTGLAAGRELIRLGYDVDIYESSDRVGGLAKTYRDGDGFVYDNGPRFIFSTLAEKIGIADQCEPVRYYEDLFVKGRYYLFPFGFVRNPRYCVSAGLATLTRNFHQKPRNLGEFLRVYYGRTFSREVLRPLIEKWAGIPANEISVDFASRLLPTNIKYIVHSLIKKLRGGVTEDYFKGGRYIVYPRGSNAVIFEALANTPGLKIHLNSPIQRIETKGDLIRQALVGGCEIVADGYLSTIPINALVQMIDSPGSASEWNRLHYRGILILFIKINRPQLLEHLWTWFPESQYRFYRIAEFKNARADLAPADKTLVSVEIGCETSDPYWQKEAPAILEDIFPALGKLYGLKKEEVLGIDLKKSPCAYPVLKASNEETQRSLTHQTPFRNLFIAGRTGMFQYRMLEGSYDSAMTCVQVIDSVLKGELGADPASPRISMDRFGRPDLVPE